MNHRMLIALAAALVVAACGNKEPAQQKVPDMGNTPGMSGMQGMGMRSDSMMPMIRAHLDSMAMMPAQFAAGVLAAHDAMASRMLDAMGSDMTMMSMQPDSAWTALVDSVKRDLADLPSLSGRALETRLRVHVARMRRLLDMHGAMMRK